MCITRWAIPPKFVGGKISGIVLVDKPAGRPHALVANAGGDRPAQPVVFDDDVVTAAMFNGLASLSIVDGNNNINAGRIDALDIEAPGTHNDELKIIVRPGTDAPDDVPITLMLKPRVIAWPFIELGF